MFPFLPSQFIQALEMSCYRHTNIARLVNTEVQPNLKQVDKAGTTNGARYRFYQGVVSASNACWELESYHFTFSNCVVIDQAGKYLSTENMCGFKTIENIKYIIRFESLAV